MNDLLVDFALGDLQIEDGDLAVGESNVQEGTLIIRHRPGSFKQSPRIGYGEKILLNGSLDGRTKREIQLQLESDQKKLTHFTEQGGSLAINWE